MMSVDDLMAMQPVIPVLTVERLEDAEPLAAALVAGGLPVLELTLRTPAAAGAITAMSRVKGAIVGAGTVLNGADVEKAVGAGAQFIVTPGLAEATVSAARKAHVPILPGVAHLARRSPCRVGRRRGERRSRSGCAPLSPAVRPPRNRGSIGERRWPTECRGPRG